MIDYITKFQNNFQSSYLLQRTLPKLLEMGIPIRKILESNVFSVNIDFDQWPGSHENDKYLIKPYNGSFFDLRHNYREIFPELCKEQDKGQKKNQKGKKQKVYKISYSINLLPSIGEYILMEKNEQGEMEKIVVNPGDSFQSLIAASDEYPIFQARPI